jgi:hypothetical protein
MEEFIFKVTQPADTYFKGTITIQATSEEEAVRIIEGFSQEDLEERCTNWYSGDDVQPAGPIEVWDNSGNIIND